MLSQDPPAPRIERDDATESWQAVFLSPTEEQEPEEQQHQPAPAAVPAAAAAAASAPAAPSGPAFTPGALWASPAVASVRSAVAAVPSAASAFASSPLAATLALPLVAAVAGAGVAVLMTRNEDEAADLEALRPPPDAPVSDKLFWRGRRLLAAAGSAADEAEGSPLRSLFAVLHAAASIAGALCLVCLSGAAAAVRAVFSPVRALLRAFGGLWEMLLPPGHTRIDLDEYAVQRPKCVSLCHRGVESRSLLSTEWRLPHPSGRC